MAMSLHDIRDWIRAAAPGARLVSDSRRVARGDVFFAYPGEGADGRRYIAAAIEAGAVREGDQVALLGIGSGLNSLMLALEW